jgi:N-acetylmuramoyl-L-alanine amidase
VTSFAAKHTYTLVIDAGHGGKDAGAVGKFSKEKTINLNVALAFGRYVEQNCPDVKVIYTRKTDVFIPLHERAAIANRNKADVFISIHTNSVASRKPVTGLETYTMGMRRSGEKLSAAMRENEVVLIEDNYKQHYSGFDPRSPESYIIFEMINDKNMLESVELAKAIQKNVCRTAGRPDKGVKQDAFLVLRETSMPACLIELGYISTASEETYLNSSANVDAMGRGIYQAFVQYKNKTTGKLLPPVQEEVPIKEERQEPVKLEVPVKQDTVVEKPAPKVKKDTVIVSPQPEVKADDVVAESLPVFKVQLMASSSKFAANDARFKGLKDVACYQEGGLWKYTIGSTSNYNEIRQVRQQAIKEFPQAFIIAFKNGVKMDVQKAIRETRSVK